MKIAVYPGSFDPITVGHIDIVTRALRVFDKVIILVADNPNKKSRFLVKDRIEMIKDSVKGLGNVEVDSTSGLSIKYAKEHGATHMIRGLRAVTDFEYEFQFSEANEYIDSSIDIVFFMSHKETTFISSSSIDELYKNGIDISSLVPKAVLEAYKNK
ncbi:MAG: pantetheine-phosphate adenylyltransferase [Bacilli bacterium]|nr:pantetheine-phosphate adenylyltransferase [Bacilli bacterium]